MDAASLLKQHQLRTTAVRRAVLECLLQATVAVPLPDLSTAVAADRVTLYRTLRTFESCGILHRVVDGTTVDKYALCGSNCSGGSHAHAHAHFHCEACGDTVCLEEHPAAPAVLPNGYQISEVQLTYRGRCGDCQQASA